MEGEGHTREAEVVGATEEVLGGTEEVLGAMEGATEATRVDMEGLDIEVVGGQEGFFDKSDDN